MSAFISQLVLRNADVSCQVMVTRLHCDQNAARRLEAMESVLWDAERGACFDFNLMTHSKHFEFPPSNLAPVWSPCSSRPEMGEKAVQYLKVGRHSGLHLGLSSEINDAS